MHQRSFQRLRKMNSAGSIEALDLAVRRIRSRFDQKGFKTFLNEEQLHLKDVQESASRKNRMMFALSSTRISGKIC